MTSQAKDPAEARRRALPLRLVAMDVDGTLTDGRIHIGPSGEAMKSFSVRDGFGLSLLREAGIQLAIVTARRSEIVEHRACELGISRVLQGVKDKAAALRALCQAAGIRLDECAFIGDDWGDLPALRIAGLAACPIDADAEVHAQVHWVSTLPAGQGAVREFAQFVLRARGQYESLLAQRLADRPSHGVHAQ